MFCIHPGLSAVASLAIAIVVANLCFAGDAATLPTGPSFRVETELFEGESVQPAARHLILFDGGVIYDLRLDDDRMATMYDPTRGRVILIDRARGQNAIVSTSELAQATAQLKAAIEQQGKSAAFGITAAVSPLAPAPAGSPAFKIAFGDVEYQTTTQGVKNPALPEAYDRFAALAAQLNVIRHVGVAPFARLILGEHIAAEGLLPLETTLEIRRGLSKQRYRSHLLVVEQLSANDRDRINELGRVLAACKEIPLDQFGN